MRAGFFFCLLVVLSGFLLARSLYVSYQSVAGGGLRFLALLTCIFTTISPIAATAAEPVEIPSNNQTTITTAWNASPTVSGPATYAIDNNGKIWQWGEQWDVPQKAAVEAGNNPVFTQLSFANGEPESLSQTDTTGFLNSSRIWALDDKGIVWYQDNLGVFTKYAEGQPYTLTRIEAAQRGGCYGITTGGNVVRFGFPGWDKNMKLVSLPSKAVSLTVSKGDYTGPTMRDSLGNVLAVLADGTVYEWQDMTFGTSTEDRLGTPSQIEFPSGVTIRQASMMKTYYYNSFGLAIDSTGQAWGWGTNTSGQLGNGKTGDNLINGQKPTPTKVNMPAGVVFTRIVAGATEGPGNESLGYGIALDQNGDAWAWGDNSVGNFGNGGYKQSLVPTKVSMPNGVKFVEIDSSHAPDTASASSWVVAKASDGSVWTWGNGPVGNNRTDNNPTIPAKATDFGSAGTGTTIACAPTTGAVPTGLMTIGLLSLLVWGCGIMLIVFRRMLQRVD